MPYRNKQYQVTASGFFWTGVYSLQTNAAQSLSPLSSSVKMLNKSVSATVNLIPRELHCGTLHPVPGGPGI